VFPLRPVHTWESIFNVEHLVRAGNTWVLKDRKQWTGCFITFAISDVEAARWLRENHIPLPDAECWEGAGPEALYHWRGLWLLANYFERFRGFWELEVKQLTEAEAAAWLVRHDYHLDASPLPEVPGPPERQAGEIAPAPQAVVAPPAYQFLRTGNAWQVRFGAEAGLLPASDGMAYISMLLRRPEEDIPALELLRSHKPPERDRPQYALQDDSSDGGAGPRRTRNVPAVTAPEVVEQSPSYQPAFDEEARRAYRDRLREIDTDELPAAERNNDLGRMRRLKEERDSIEAHLAAGLDAKGRVRPLGAPPAELARQRVRHALKRAYDKMRAATPPLPDLAGHLEASIIGSGTSFRYSPAPPAPPWVLES
jgi:hypothetical protein